MAKSERKPAALVVGVGPGLGAALARRFSHEGMAVAIAARRVDKLSDLAKETTGRAYACDATSEISVDDLFAAVERDLGLPRLVVFNASAFTRKPVVELTPAEIESAWRASCLGGFLVGRAAARAMLPKGPGTILLIGENAEGSRLAPDAIAGSYWHLHSQPKSAWTLELDLRPWVEKF